MIPKKTINRLIAFEISKTLPKSAVPTLSRHLSREFVNSKLYDFYKTRTNSMTTRNSRGIRKFILLYSTLLLLFLLVVILAIIIKNIILGLLSVALLFALFKLTSLYNLRRVLGYKLSRQPNVIIPEGTLEWVAPISIYRRGGKIIIGPYKLPKGARQVKLYLAQKDGVYVALADYYKKGDLSLTNNLPLLLRDALRPTTQRE